ncbi:MAG: PorV/PorQ family protein [Chloroherpetonaceae bacterium]|nr:PorV/PorQ family protein [Chloroherpetonaceae bacterium]MDW8438062.1 PorV/PorQ family protein [Chloroherpetonaceae bacterium]
MKNLKSLVAILFLTTLLAQETANAQERRVGASSGNQVLIPVGGVGLGMSGAATATLSGVEAIYWNPGAVAYSRKGELMFSSMSYLADIRVNYLAASANLGNVGTLGVAIKSLNFGQIPRTTDEDPDGLRGETWSPNYLTASLTYSRTFTDRIAAGATFKIINETILSTTAVGLAFDFGVQYTTPFNLKVAVVLKNLGNQMRYAGPDLERQIARFPGDGPQNFLRTEIIAAAGELPSSFEIGAAYDFKFDTRNMVTLAGNFRNNNFSEDEYQLGAQYSFQDLIFLRGGMNFDLSKHGENVFTNSFTLGAGINYRFGGVSIMLDYAYRSAKFFSGNQVFAIRLGF